VRRPLTPAQAFDGDGLEDVLASQFFPWVWFDSGENFSLKTTAHTGTWFEHADQRWLGNDCTWGRLAGGSRTSPRSTRRRVRLERRAVLRQPRSLEQRRPGPRQAARWRPAGACLV